MHLKVTFLAAVALAAAAGARKNVRDVEPCAQISKLVADANDNHGAYWTTFIILCYGSNDRSQCSSFPWLGTSMLDVHAVPVESGGGILESGSKVLGVPVHGGLSQK